MIRTDTVIINDRQFTHTWSDSGVKVHGGFPEADYDEVYDPADAGRTYTETEIPVGEETEAEEIVDILTGEQP